MFSRLILLVAFILSLFYRGLVLTKDVVIVYTLYFVVLAPFALVKKVFDRNRKASPDSAWIAADILNADRRKLPRRLFYSQLLPTLFKRRKFGKIVLYFLLFHMGRLVAKKNVSPWDQPYVYANF